MTSVSIPSSLSSVSFYYGDTKAGTPTITASGSLASASQVEAITPGSAINLVITSTAFSAPASSSATHSFTATLEDGFGNPTTSISSTTVSVSSTSQGAAPRLPGGASVTSVTLPANTPSVTAFYGDTLAGSPVITASGTALSPNGTQSETITPAAATQLVVTSQPPASTPAGTSFTTSVAVEDAFGNLVTSSAAPVNLAIATNPGGGALTCATDPLNASGGVATFSCSINKVGTGYTLTASSSGLTSATTGAFTITPALPSKFVITSTAVSGAASSTATLGPITVQEQDAFGNPTTSAETVNLASGSSGTKEFSATSGGTAITSVTIPSGSSSATFYYGDTKAGTPTITASGSLTSATQAVTVTAGTGTQLVVTSQPPASTPAGTSFTTSVAVEDAFGNLVTSSAAPVNLAIATNPGGGALTCATDPLNASGGVATFSCSINKVGTGYTLTASNSGLTSATTGAFTITPAAATQLVVTSQPPASTPAGIGFTTRGRCRGCSLASRLARPAATQELPADWNSGGGARLAPTAQRFRRRLSSPARSSAVDRLVADGVE